MLQSTCAAASAAVAACCCAAAAACSGNNQKVHKIGAAATCEHARTLDASRDRVRSRPHQMVAQNAPTLGVVPVALNWSVINCEPTASTMTLAGCTLVVAAVAGL